ncbi:uncharacterized protein Z520_07548 [Fonsecaea multimorphosa CBS 102226]|uniref:Nuclear protein DGCR14 n=1 Tax=Fonsecaea multimorphosa CBS 102226 TaxID=1442371 RepID=A0A0D2KJT0_9EURO|nr:uncharacterized protein Z520_07548 [Fonsecaea multimorphosa CBS 102226]KIX96828.1 hypothetical protein Z520_07548 [Fonsecaea multimorphosa CBS 102226]OAL22507.1 hypothetical protein AYO22_07065 [Fonsecaea multimorphosa]
MATSQASQTLVRRPSAGDVALMPPPPLKRIKRPPKVLDEDEYTQALSDIIARDYFPGLLESQAQHEYLTALDSGNESWIVEAAQKLRQAAAPAAGSKRRSARNTRFDRTPSATPRVLGDTPVGYTGSETPMTVAGTEVEDDRKEEPKQLDTSRFSLGSFQAKYTSEDNESFNALLDKQNHKRREKHAHLWTQDQRVPSARQIAYRAREARLLKEHEESEAAAGKALVPMTSGATDARLARPDAWKIKRPDNGFMFNATSVDEDGLQTVQEVKEQNSKAGPKHVVYANTRFPPMQYVDDEPGPVPPSPSLNTEIIAQRTAAHARQRGGGDAETTTDFPGSETPRVNGYAFVDEDEPENLPETESSAPSYRDLLAGQVDSTPNPFKISEIRKREDLHLRMLEKQARRKREKDRETIRTPAGGSAVGTPSSSAAAAAAGNMTPAARRLMEKLGGNKTPARTGLGLDGIDAKKMWTPGRTPRRRHAGK